PVWNRVTGQVVGMLQAVGVDDAASDAYVIETDVYVIDVGALVAEWPDVLWHPPPCPHRGLAAFDETSERPLFGRHEVLPSLAATSRTLPLVAIVGKSGSGKSSTVQAGLLPALRRAAPVDVVTLTPGDRPMLALAARIAGPDPDPRTVAEVSRNLSDRGLAEY